MKQKKRKIKLSKQQIFKKLSSSNIFILVCINALVPFLALWITKMFDSKDVSWGVMLICVGVTFAININFIVKPILRMENIIEALGDTKELPEEIDAFRQGSDLEKLFFDMFMEQKAYMEREYSAEMLRQETELMALQSQINPHFLYNTLDSIRGYALLHDVAEIADMTEALARLFRSMTAKAGKLITLKEELEVVDSYMVIQQFRFNNKFIYEKKIKEEALLDSMVLNLILQPVVENAIIHGLESRSEKGKICISARSTKKRLLIKVEDNGIGIGAKLLTQLNERMKGEYIIDQTKASKNHIGIALPNINQRIRLQFGEDYGLNIMSTEHINTVIEIVLPLIYETEQEGWLHE